MSRAQISEYFKQIGRWMEDDIGREIKIAQLSDKPEGRARLSELGIPLGGGNLLMALGLVAYTEALGRLRVYNSDRSQFSNDPACFNAFFDAMAGGAYAAWWRDKWRGPRNKTPYDVLRNGLAHEYHPKVPSNIHIGTGEALGLDYEGDRLVFNTEPYYRHFCAEMKVLRDQLLARQPEAEVPPPTGFWTGVISQAFPVTDAVASGMSQPTAPIRSVGSAYGPQGFIVRPTSQRGDNEPR